MARPLTRSEGSKIYLELPSQFLSGFVVVIVGISSIESEKGTTLEASGRCFMGSPSTTRDTFPLTKLISG